TSGTIDFLHSMRRKEGGILKMVKGFISPPPREVTEIEPLNIEDLINNAENILKEVESKTSPLEEQLNSLDSEKSQLENARKVAENLKDFDVDLADMEESKFTSIIIGKIPLASYDTFKE